MLNGNRVLFISAHPDDSEFAAGGTITRLRELGKEIFLLVMSNPVQSLPDGFDPDTLIREQKKSAQVLGIPEANIQFYDFPVRRFSERRQDILEELIVAGREISPDVVFCSGINDVHQDHNQCAQEVLRAFRKKTICSFDVPWNTNNSVLNLNIQLSESHILKKIEAIQCYESQSVRPYSDTDYIKGWAKTRGIYSNYKYAESFELVTMSVD